MGQIKNIKLHIVTDIKLQTNQPITMVYKRFIHAGRVVYVANGKYAGKLVVVADVVDHGRALCENPVHGVPRQVFRFQDLNITDISVNIPHGARGGAIKKQYDAVDVDAQWAKTAWAKKDCGKGNETFRTSDGSKQKWRNNSGQGKSKLSSHN